MQPIHLFLIRSNWILCYFVSCVSMRSNWILCYGHSQDVAALYPSSASSTERRSSLSTWQLLNRTNFKCVSNCTLISAIMLKISTTLRRTNTGTHTKVMEAKKMRAKFCSNICLNVQPLSCESNVRSVRVKLNSETLTRPRIEAVCHQLCCVMG